MTAVFLAVILVCGAAACEPARERAGPAAPTEPRPPPAPVDVTGAYKATQLRVERASSSAELIGEPDTRISLQLNGDGSTRGQLKIGTDPELRTKVALDGTWRLLGSSRVTFDFHEPSFIEQIAFQISGPALTGSWVGDGVRVYVRLERDLWVPPSGRLTAGLSWLAAVSARRAGP